MLRRMMVTGGTVLLVLVASMAQAQDQKRPGRGGGFQGFGPPGGGFGGGGSAGLVGIPEVQKELAVSDEQKGLLEDMQAELREKMRGAFGNFNPQDFQNLSEEELKKRRDEAGKKFEQIGKEAEEALTMILEPKQLERLNQLRLQREGIQSFSRDDVAKKLGFSEQQREKIKKVQDDAGAATRALFQNMQNLSDEERREAFTKMREQREKTQKDILAVLTADQKESWEKLQGKKFEFPQPRGFGGFGGGAGGDSPRRKSESKKKDQ